MSRFDFPRVAVFAAPDEIVCRSFGRPGITADSFRAAISGPAELEAALSDYLSTPPRRLSRLHVMFSHALASFIVAPWSDALLEPREAQSYLRDSFEAVLGEAARRLRVTSEDRGYREPRIACGVDAAWIEAIEHAALARQARIEWVGPWIERAWRHHRARIDRPDAWCVAVERSGYAVGSVRGGRLADISFQHGDTATASISRQLQRLSLREGLDGELPVYLVDAGSARDDLPTGWKSLPWRAGNPADWVTELAA